MQKKSLIVYIGLFLAISGLMFTNGTVLPNQRDAWTNETSNGANAETIRTNLIGTTDDPSATTNESTVTCNEMQIISESTLKTNGTSRALNYTSPPQTFEEWRNFILAWNNLTLADLENADPITIEKLDQEARIYEGRTNGTYTDEQKNQLLAELHQSPAVAVTFGSTTDGSFDYQVTVIEYVLLEDWFRVCAYMDYNKSDTDYYGGDHFSDGSFVKEYGPFGWGDEYPTHTLPYLAELDPLTSFMGSSYDMIGWFHADDHHDQDLFILGGSNTGIQLGDHYFVVQVLFGWADLFEWLFGSYHAYFSWETWLHEVSIQDDDTTPPVIEDVIVGVFGVVIDNWPLITVKVKATDASGILQIILINGIPWPISGVDEDGYCWTLIPSPRVPGPYWFEIVVWDADLDRLWDNLPSAPWVCGFYIFDDDTRPPAIEEVKAFPASDSQEYIIIRVNATDARGIWPWIFVDGVPYLSVYDSGYHWIAVPSPRTPGIYSAKITVWDADLDWVGDNLPATQTASYYVYDDDVDPPVIEDTIIFSATDSQEFLRVGVKATDASGILPVIYFDGVPYYVLYSDADYYWTLVPSPRTPGIYSAKITVWDADLDWVGDNLPATQTASYYVYDDDVDPPEVSWSTTSTRWSEDMIQLNFTVDATDASGIGAVLIQIGDYTFTDLGPHTVTLAPGRYTAYISVTDNDTDRTDDSKTASIEAPIVLDLSPPTTELILMPHFSDETGCYATSATICSLSATDDVSGVAQTYYRINDGDWITYTTGFTLSGPEGAYTISYYSIDYNDNEETFKTQTVVLDNTAPVTSLTPSGVHGLGDWYKSDVLVTLSPTDGSSGVARTLYSYDGSNWATYEGPFAVGREGSTTIYYYSIDNLGNVEATKTEVVNIDWAAPETTKSLSGTVGLGDWYLSPVTVTLAAFDDYSGLGVTQYSLNGIDWNTYAGPFIISNEGVTTLYYRSIDNAGNVEDRKITYIWIDKTPPTTTTSLDGTQGLNDWYVSPLIVTLSATDAFSGVDHTEYKVDDGPWTTYTGSFTIRKEGTTTISYRSLDKASNPENIGTASFRIDTTPPATTNTLQGEQGLRDWYKSDVTVTLSAADPMPGSGLAFTEYSLDGTTWTPYETPFTISYRDITTVYYKSTDNAGNTGETDSVEVKIYMAAETAIGPQTLNLKSKGQWVTVYIELPQDCNPNEIDVSTFALWFGDNSIQASWGEVQDGLLMVKFDRAALINLLSGIQPDTLVQLGIWGEIAGCIFAGTVTARVI